MKKYILITAVLGLFSVCIARAQETDISGLAMQDIKLILGGYIRYQPSASTDFIQRAYSWGEGRFLVNSSILIDWDSEKKAQLEIIDASGIPPFPIRKIEKTATNEYKIYIGRPGSEAYSSFPEEGAISIVILDSYRIMIIEGDLGVIGTVDGKAVLYKVSGPQ
jgi:hypothetical protein